MTASNWCANKFSETGDLAYFEMFNLWKEKEMPNVNKGRLVSTDKKFFVTLSHVYGSTEVPVYAETIEEAHDLATLKYTGSGFEVARVRPDVKQ